ncbi:MAG: hypothetical protein AB7O73_03690 [Bacteroidia bacterium]
MKSIWTYLIVGLFFVLFVTTNSSCKKDQIITDPGSTITFSADSVLFDTVFTTIGSSTRNIRVRNPNKQRISISKIYLEKGNASPFIINVDGAKGISHSDVEIAAQDSMYIFIQVNINPLNQSSPLIINDAIVFETNGNTQKVHLEAWGQDAYYHYPNRTIKFSDGSYLPYSIISSNPNVDTTWANDKPHVIYGWLVVDSAQKLTIPAGTKVHLNNKAGLWVYRYGTLKVKGTYGNEVEFLGARNEPEYFDEPGQWDRIWINEGSLENEIDYAIIKNAYIGVQAELLGSNFNEPKRLRLTNTVIQNMSKWGLFGQAFNIYGGNNVISNCQEHGVNLQLGGNYKFIHCTFANYWAKESKRELSNLRINNYTAQQVLPLDTCYFGNCVIYGSNPNEITLDINASNMSFPPNYLFDNCALLTSINTSDISKFRDNIVNKNPDFTDRFNYDFSLGNNTEFGPLTGTNVVNNTALFPVDITGTARTGTIYAGAYHK